MEISPYFRALDRQGRICPWCHKRARIEPSALNPDVAMWSCDCGWFQAIEAPRNAKSNIIKPDFGEVPAR